MLYSCTSLQWGQISNMIVIGPTFFKEVQAAGLNGLPFTWNATGLINTDQLTPDQLSAVQTVLTAHNPNNQLLSVILFSNFLNRWQDAEYILLLQKRAQAVQAGTNAALIRGWDLHMALNVVDLNSTAAQTLKTSLVSANILTQARADVIFS